MFLFLWLLSPVTLSGVLIIYCTPKCVHNEVAMYLSSPHAHYDKKAFRLIQPSFVLIHTRLLVLDVSDMRKILCLSKHGQECTPLKCKIMNDAILYSNFNYHNSFN